MCSRVDPGSATDAKALGQSSQHHRQLGAQSRVVLEMTRFCLQQAAPDVGRRKRVQEMDTRERRLLPDDEFSMSLVWGFD